MIIIWAGMNEEIRTFIAIEIPASIRQAIAGLQSDLKQFAAQISWVRPENIHITLQFLGNIRQSRVPEIGDALREAVKDYHHFTISIKGTGAFPNTRRPRVLWIGARSEGEYISELARTVRFAMSRLGFPEEKQSFKAHLTIGRVKGMRGIDAVMAAFRSRQDFFAGSFEADKIVFMQSQLLPTGAKYTHLRKIKL